MKKWLLTLAITLGVFGLALAAGQWSNEGTSVLVAIPDGITKIMRITKDGVRMGDNTAPTATLDVGGKLTVAGATGNLISQGTLAGAYPAVQGTTATYTLTASDCGTTYIATAASGTQTYTLPGRTAAPGCMFRFIAGNAGGEVLIDAPEATGTTIVITTFAAVGTDADTSIVTDTDASPGVKNTAATNAVGDSCVLMSNGVETWYSVGLCNGIWAAQ